MGGKSQFLCFLLHVLDGDFDGGQNDLLLVDDVDPGFDVGEGVGGGEDGLALELLVQVAVGAAVQREGRAVHEAPQVVVLVEVGDPVLHLVRVEVGLHVRDLDVGLVGIKFTFVHRV